MSICFVFSFSPDPVSGELTYRYVRLGYRSDRLFAFLLRLCALLVHNHGMTLTPNKMDLTYLPDSARELLMIGWLCSRKQTAAYVISPGSSSPLMVMIHYCQK